MSLPNRAARAPAPAPLAPAVALAAILAIGAAGVGLLLPYAVQAVATDALRQQASSIAQLLERRLVVAIESGNDTGLTETLAALNNVTGARFAQVQDRQGAALSTWTQAQAAATPQAPFDGPGLDQALGELRFEYPLGTAGRPLGTLRLALSAAELLAAAARLRWAAGLAGCLVLLGGLWLGGLMAARWAAPMQRIETALHTPQTLLARLSGLIGNIIAVVERVRVAGNDVTSKATRIGSRVEDTARAADTMLASLQALASDVMALEHNAIDSSASLMHMAQSDKQVAGNVQTMADSAKTTSGAIERMASSISEIAESIEQLNQTIRETSLLIQRMDRAIDDVERTARDTARLSERVSSDAETGVEALRKTLHGIDNIKESSQSAALVIGNLGMRISEIGAILRVIDEVAAQTKLLSLNAAIIAAQAGEHGRGFSVVADQIKELAQRTGASTREISSLIAGIQEESRNATAAMGLGVTNVEVGVTLGHAAADALEKIRLSANESTAMIRKIAQTTVDQNRGSKQITVAIESIAETVGHIRNYSLEQARGAEQIISSSHDMNLLTDQVRRSSDEQALGSQQVISAIEVINVMVSRLSGAHKEQRAGAEAVQRNVEDMRGTSQGQSASLLELEQAIASLTTEAQALVHELRPIAKRL